MNITDRILARIDYATSEQLEKALHIALEGLDQYALENASLYAALAAFKCRSILDGSHEANQQKDTPILKA